MVKEYWRRVAAHALQETLQTLRLATWVDIMLKAAGAAAVILALRFWGSQEASNDELIVRTAGAAIIILLFPLVYACKFMGVPPAIENEARVAAEARFDALGKQIALLLQSAEANIEIEGLHKDNENKRYIVVRNTSDTNSLKDCLVRIESLTYENANDDEILSNWPLRTEMQTESRPEGRFNLDPDQRKYVLLCEPVSGYFIWRIVAAGEKRKKRANGTYRIRVRATTQDGGRPAEATVVLSGHEISFEPSSI